MERERERWDGEGLIDYKKLSCDCESCLGKSEIHRAGHQEGQFGNSGSGADAAVHRKFNLPQGNLSSVLKIFH